MVLDVPAGVHLARPIVIRWAAGAPGSGAAHADVIALGDGAQATRRSRSSSASGRAPRPIGPQSFLGRDARGHARARGTARRRQPPGAARVTTIAFQHRNAVIGEGATLHWALAQLGVAARPQPRSTTGSRATAARSSRSRSCSAASDQLFDLTSYTRHIGRDTTGNLLSKGALLDEARSFMKGMIVIEKTAVGTDSFLGEFGMNLSKAARSVAIPSLEIDQPDCRRAAHASSVGPIDESQLFYLESRGIPPDEARKFIVLGFLEPVVARVPARPTRGIACASCSRPSGTPGSRRGGRRRRVRRIDLLGVDEVPDGTMKMAWVDGTDQVLVVNPDGELSRRPGHLQPRVLRARQGLPDARARSPARCTCRASTSRTASRSTRRPSCRWRSTRSSSRTAGSSSRSRTARSRSTSERADHRYERPVARGPASR